MIEIQPHVSSESENCAERTHPELSQRVSTEREEAHGGRENKRTELRHPPGALVAAFPLLHLRIAGYRGPPPLLPRLYRRRRERSLSSSPPICRAFPQPWKGHVSEPVAACPYTEDVA